MCLDPDVPRAPTAPRISVVIPALDEARNLPCVFASLPKDIYDR
jgi:glycosyltransferase involved in cell wall biosynthesis